MRNERDAIHAELEKQKLIAEGVLESIRVPRLEEENKRSNKVKMTSYQEIMESPIRKIHEEARMLEKLAKCIIVTLFLVRNSYYQWREGIQSMKANH